MTGPGKWRMFSFPGMDCAGLPQAADGYAITRISQKGMLYGEEPAGYVPLRLQEARAALFDPMPSLESMKRGSIRTSTVVYHGAPITCILLSGPDNGLPAATSGRRWDEAEECIDPQSELLETHSPVPGRYYAYEYGSGSQFAGRALASKVVVTEGGRTVSTIAVVSLTEAASADASLFVPTAEMKANGRPSGLGGARKIFRNFGQAPAAGARRRRQVRLRRGYTVGPTDGSAFATTLQPEQRGRGRGGKTDQLRARAGSGTTA